MPEPPFLIISALLLLHRKVLPVPDLSPSHSREAPPFSAGPSAYLSLFSEGVRAGPKVGRIKNNHFRRWELGGGVSLIQRDLVLTPPRPESFSSPILAFQVVSPATQANPSLPNSSPLRAVSSD